MDHLMNNFPHLVFVKNVRLFDQTTAPVFEILNNSFTSTTYLAHKSHIFCVDPKPEF